MITTWKNTVNPESEDDIRYRGLTPDERRYREIQKAAFLIWIEHGGGNGSDLQDWLKAEHEIDSKNR